MSLFDVPGWAVPSAPVRESSHQVSKKRKRPGSNSKLDAAGVNVEKLMVQLANSNTQPESGASKPKKRSKTHGQTGAVSPTPKKVKREGSPERNAAVAPKTVVRQVDKLRSTPHLKSNKKVKPHNAAGPKLKTSNAVSPEKILSAPSPSLTALQKSMKESLGGARFRLINENLYKSDSHEAHRMMQEDPTVFEEYHTGFRHQVLSWPTNPVDHYVAKFASYPPRTLIADLGCGDAALAKGLLPKEISVISFDLVSDGTFVVEADICDKIPLPGSEGSQEGKSSGEGQVVDVVVCALSLMGVNWVKCVREAWRILTPGGQLHIAEVTSRFTDIEQFETLIASIGFRLKTKDDSNTHFVLFEFTKISRTHRSDKEWTKMITKGSLLKPCEYKRR